MRKQTDTTGILSFWPDSHTRLMNLKVRRKFWFKIHVYLGLFIGVILVLLGLTGSLLVFWQEIDELLNPEYMTVSKPEPDAQFLRTQTIISAVETHLPDNAEPSYLYFPRTGSSVYKVFYSVTDSDEDGVTTYTLSIDPYTAKSLGSYVFYHAHNPLKHRFIGFIFKLHYALLLGDNGMITIGILGLLMMFLILTGVIVWWPLTGKWLQALTIKRNGSSQRFMFDLHKTTGAYFGLLLFVVLLSGVYMNLPMQFIWLVEQFSPVTVADNYESDKTKYPEKTSLSNLIQRVEQSTGEGTLKTVVYPYSDTGIYQLCYQDLPSLKAYFIDSRCYFMDQYSGQILKVYDQKHINTASRFLAWLWPLHSGQAFDLLGRIGVFIVGLLCPVLYVTGVIRWLQKRKAQRVKKSS